MADGDSTDTWSSTEAYERFMGRWSRLVAREFLAWLAQPDGLRWLDAGCGSGSLVESVLGLERPAAVTGIDPSPAFIDAAKTRITEAKASFQIADAREIPLADDVVDCTVSGLVLNFVPEPGKALAELRRVTVPGGVVAVYVWDYAGEMQMLREFWDAVTALWPERAGLDESIRFPDCNPEWLRNLFESGGMSDIATTSITVPIHFANFADFWTPFLGGQGPAPGFVRDLDEDERDRLRRTLVERLNAHDADRPIRMSARAWAVCGTA